MRFKKILSIAALALGTLLPAQAQITAYVCDKYDYDAIDIESQTDVVFSDDQLYVTIGSETFEVADIDSIVFTKPQFPSVDIVWDGSTATVTIPSSITGVSYSTNGGHVTIVSTNTTDELLYTLSGSSTNGSLTLTGSYKLTMHLDGVELTNPSGAAVDIECGKRIEVKMMKGTTNTFIDGASGDQKAAFYTKGHLELKGKGTLNVTGNTKHALCAKEYLMLKPSTGTINILGAVNDGIHCGEGSKAVADYEDCRFIMNGGTVTISNCLKDCIDADDYGSMFINNGSLTLNVSAADGIGLSCDSILTMTGGDITLNVTGTEAQGIRSCYTGYYQGGNITGTVSGSGSKGIRGRKITKTSGTVLNGGNLYFQGTNVNLTATGASTSSATCAGIYVDADLYQTAGNLYVNASGTATDFYVKGTDSQTGGTRTAQ